MNAEDEAVLKIILEYHERVNKELEVASRRPRPYDNCWCVIGGRDEKEIPFYVGVRHGETCQEAADRAGLVSWSNMGKDEY